MKFVHMTSANSISRIRRSGLRLGNGRRGRGLYALPLFHAAHVSWSERHDPNTGRLETLRISSHQRTNMKSWGFLAGRPGMSRGAGIIFQLRDEHWPVKLFVHVSPTSGLRLLESLEQSGLPIAVQPATQAWARECAVLGAWTTAEIEVGTPRALGLVLNGYLADHTVEAGGGEEIEVLISKPVPAACIVKVVPLFRTNKDHRSSRDRRCHNHVDD